jgi:predicted O-methyltransferase YrrM
MEKLREEYSDIFKQFTDQKTNNRRLWNVGPETGKLLYDKVIESNPSRILEIGTSNGYSTFWLAMAAEKIGAEIDTIEVEKNRLDMARENLKGFTNINFIHGPAEELIPGLKCSYGLIFLDANKPEYYHYIDLLMPDLQKNTVIIADNVNSHKDSVHEYLDFVRNSGKFKSETVDIESGLEISVYK